MNEIKTSEQVRAELEDKKVGKAYLSEFENGIKKELDDFKSVLFDFRPKHEINHVFDAKEIKSLNLALNEVVLKLQSVSIPPQIEIVEKKEHKITFADATTKWLAWYCSIAFLIAIVGFCYGYNAYRNVEETNLANFEKGMFTGRNQIYNISTPAGKARIDKSHPNWRTVK
jgi:hypothetical protein